ncbi:pentapeptide repeat-containing protein [Nonomuraea bangladeshensis]|uniref:pentapeptide repeat-containing protein n=1 Tax=Nonomuraea bangladeshensis TaxID=404385 RepID=UPI0031E1B732
MRPDSLPSRIVAAFARTSPVFRPSGDGAVRRSWWRAWTRTSPSFARSSSFIGPGLDLHHAAFVFANLTHADLTRANLTGANLVLANLTHANLTEANLTGARLASARLISVNLTGAILTEARLTNANLTGANLTEARLTNANLTSANLTDTTLIGAELTGAVWNEQTRWPTAEWTERLHASSERLQDGRLQIRVWGSSNNAVVHA